MDWPDEAIVDYFARRFQVSDGRPPWIAGGTRPRLPDRSYGRAVQFWSSVKARAAELLDGREPVPGIDYALTEAVHCKSTGEKGVPEALGTCVERYLGRVVAASGARLIVCLGRYARATVNRVLGVDLGDGPWERIAGPEEIGDRIRYITWLPGPGAGLPKTFAKMTADERSFLQSVVAGRPSNRPASH